MDHVLVPREVIKQANDAISQQRSENELLMQKFAALEAKLAIALEVFSMLKEGQIDPHDARDHFEHYAADPSSFALVKQAARIGYAVPSKLGEVSDDSDEVASTTVDDAWFYSQLKDILQHN
jgi:hypothetical protein